MPTSAGFQTFVITAQRVVGSGNCRLDAEASGPALFDVYYLFG